MYTLEILRTSSEIIQSIILTMSKLTTSYAFNWQDIPHVSSPFTNVSYESACNTYHNSFVGEERRVLVLVD